MIKIFLKKFCCMLFFVCGTFLHSESLESNIHPEILKGIELHDSSRNGDAKNLEATIEKCLETLDPFVSSSPLALVFYGSALTVKAGFLVSKNPIKSLSFLDKGCVCIDKAVNLDSSHPLIRLVRLENGIEVSRTSPVKRYAVIKSDVDFLLDENNTKDFSLEKKAESLLYCAHYFLDAGNLDKAFELFEKAVKVSPDSNAGKAAQTMIEKYSE